MVLSNPPTTKNAGAPGPSGPLSTAPQTQVTGAGALGAKRSAQTAFEDEPETPALVKMNAAPYAPQRHINDHYDIVGFISSGTYGRVYKALAKRQPPSQQAPQVKHPVTGRAIEAFAIKKFKPDKEGELQYTGISQSAIREMALCTELSHPALIHLVEIILESKCIFMVFEYAEHDLLQIIHHHSLLHRTPIPASTLRSCMHQLLSGLLYLHQNWVIHRDLKPANIMVTSSGAIKIGDLGLARLFYKPLHALFSGDKVVVTIWYRAPELLLGSRHYTPAIDLWAVGCIFAELIGLRPIFKGEEAKQDSKKAVPFQRNQMGKIGEILGLPKKQDWPLLTAMPEWPNLQTVALHNAGVNRPVGLEKWYRNTMNNNNYNAAANNPPPNDSALDLLKKLLEYDPLKRLTAEQALQHPYFIGESGTEKPTWNCFEGLENKYPARKIASLHDSGFRRPSRYETIRDSLETAHLNAGKKDLHGLSKGRVDSLVETVDGAGPGSKGVNPADATYGGPGGTKLGSEHVGKVIEEDAHRNVNPPFKNPVTVGELDRRRGGEQEQDCPSFRSSDWYEIPSDTDAGEE